MSSRTDLIEKLAVLEPALAVNQLIPLLTHYWFTGNRVLSYNGAIALSVPHKTDFRGAVPGKFLELLRVEADDRAQLQLTHSGQELVVKQGKRTSFHLAMLRPDFVFEMPEFTNSNPPLGGRLMWQFVNALRHCLISVGRDTATVEQLGITLEPEQRAVLMYATNGATISRARIKGLQVPFRLILPTMFCEQMVQLFDQLPRKDGKRDADFQIGRGELGGTEHGYALFRAGNIRLYGRLLETRSPLNFKGTVEYHLPSGDYREQLVEVPSDLQAAVERACIVCDAQRRLMRVTVGNGRMVLKSKSDNEEVTDELVYPHKGGSARLEIQLEPKLLKKAADYKTMLIHGPCIVMAKAPALYLISCSTV